MPNIPIFIRDENGIPLNDINVFINDIPAGTIDYGDVYSFPCGTPFKLRFENLSLYYGANLSQTHNNRTSVATTNEDYVWNLGLDVPVSGSCTAVPIPYSPPIHDPLVLPYTTYYAATLTTPTGTYNYANAYGTGVSPVTQAMMLAEIVIAINAQTATHKIFATLTGNVIYLVKTEYTSTNYNGLGLDIDMRIYRGYTTSDTSLGMTTCIGNDFIEVDFYESFRRRYSHTQDIYDRVTLFIEDVLVPFVYENDLYFDCCNNWNVDSDNIHEVGEEWYPMHVILATPSYMGCQSEFYIVRTPCSNLVSVYDMTNIPYCKYVYNMNDTPADEDILLDGRNVKYTYKCWDTYTIRQEVTRCIETDLPAEGCGCRDEVAILPECVASSIQTVDVDKYTPDISIGFERGGQCTEYCADCADNCADVCLKETFTINYSAMSDYVCCTTTAPTIELYVDNILMETQGAYGTYSYDHIFFSLGKHEIKVVVTDCCGEFILIDYVDVVNCKPTDIDFEWNNECDCTDVVGSMSRVGNQDNVVGSGNPCNCVPEDTEIVFKPTYKLPYCGCENDVVPTPSAITCNNGITATFTSVVTCELPALNYGQVIPVGTSSMSFVGCGTSGTTYNLGSAAIALLGNDMSGLPCNEAYLLANDYIVPDVFLPFGNLSVECTPLSSIDYLQVCTAGGLYNIGVLSYICTANVLLNTIDWNVGDPATGANAALFAASFTQTPIPLPAVSLISQGTCINTGSGLYFCHTAVPAYTLPCGFLQENYPQYFEQYALPTNTYPYLQWYVDEILVKEVSLASLPIDDRLLHSFHQGCHTVTLRVGNCAGYCERTYNVCAGETIVLVKDECYKWYLNDCVDYTLPTFNPNSCDVYDTLYTGAKFMMGNLCYQAISEVNCENWATLPIPYVPISCPRYRITLLVKDVNGVPLKDMPYVDTNYLGGNLIFSVPKDGIYKVYITIDSFNYTNNRWDVIHYVEYPLIEWCGIYTCRERKLQEMMCMPDCREVNPQLLMQQQYDMIRFNDLWQQYMYLLGLEYSTYSIANTTVLMPDHLNNLNTLNEIFNEIVKICNGCGCNCVNNKYTCGVQIKPNVNKNYTMTNVGCDSCGN